jgi:hypothetical protein
VPCLGAIFSPSSRTSFSGDSFSRNEELSDYNEFLTSMWRNFSRIGFGFRKLDSGSELFDPANFADVRLNSANFVRKFSPIFFGQFDEEDLVLGFDCDDDFSKVG